MTHIRLIISDIDGTILNDHHQIDPQLVALIPDLKSKTIPFVLASARSPKGMAPIAKELGIEECPMACYNGALIQKGEQVLFRASFGQDGGPELYRLGQPTLSSGFDQPL